MSTSPPHNTYDEFEKWAADTRWKRHWWPVRTIGAWIITFHEEFKTVQDDWKTQVMRGLRAFVVCTLAGSLLAAAITLYISVMLWSWSPLIYKTLGVCGLNGVMALLTLGLMVFLDDFWGLGGRW